MSIEPIESTSSKRSIKEILDELIALEKSGRLRFISLTAIVKEDSSSIGCMEFLGPATTERLDFYEIQIAQESMDKSSKKVKLFVEDYKKTIEKVLEDLKEWKKKAVKSKKVIKADSISTIH